MSCLGFFDLPPVPYCILTYNDHHNSQPINAEHSHLKGFNVKAHLVLFLILLSISSSHAQIYKWVDEKGRSHFSDKPPPNTQILNNTIQPAPKVKSESKPKSFNIKDSKLLQLQNLLHDNKIEALNKKIAELALNYTQGNISEDKYITALNAFTIENKGVERNFELWLKATPHAYQPHLAYAIYQYNLGWLARGNRWASETTEHSMESFKHHLNKAHNKLKISLKKKPNSIITYYYLMKIALSNGKHDEIKRLKNKALKLFASSYYIRKVYLKSLTPRWGGSFDEMYNFMGEVNTYAGKHPALSSLQGAVLLEMADLKSLSKLYTSADDFYTRSLESGRHHETLFKRGKNKYHLKQYKKALNDLNEAIRLNPEHSDYYYWRSKTFIALKENPLAMKDINTAYKLNPYDRSTQKTRSWLAKTAINPNIRNAELPKYDAEIITLSEALKKTPLNDQLLHNRSQAYFKKGDLRSSLKDIKSAIEINRDEYKYYVFIDYVLFKQRNLDLIIQYWERYIIRHPRDARAYLELSGTYSHKKDFKSAMNYAKKSADLGSSEGFIAYQKFKQIMDNLANIQQ